MSSLTSCHSRLGLAGGILLALWLLALLFGPDWLAALGFTLNPHGHAHLYAHGHPFADARMFWGVPNAVDVLSNVPLAVAGNFQINGRDVIVPLVVEEPSVVAAASFMAARLLPPSQFPAQASNLLCSALDVSSLELTDSSSELISS